MRNKKIVIFALMFFLSVFLISNVLAEVSHCCEKTKVKAGGSGGAWCVDADISECDENYLSEPTACISTSYCALGTCVDKQGGDCIENTPQRGCDSDLGFWFDGAPEEIPQCQLGCCFVGDGTAFVTQTRCNGFASLYGVATSFQKSIQDEMTCIASAAPNVKGACVFEENLDTTCKMLTRSECQNLNTGTRNTQFHEGFLCTADELATNCAITDNTNCAEGRDEVFFLDSCGNLANVYDSNKIRREGNRIVPNGEAGQIYWTRIMPPTCGVGSTNCGNCNYYDGSTCKSYDRNADSTKPLYGDYVCRNLDCSFDNDGDGRKETYLHGESWCAESPGVGNIDVTGGNLQQTSVNNLNVNLPGSRYFRMICYNGEVTIEPCADRRAEVCIQAESENARTEERSDVDKFRSAACRVNKWQDCITYANKEDCEDFAIGDCQWVEGNGNNESKCVPLFAPGFDIGSSDTTASGDVCGLVSTTCSAKYTKKGAIIGELLGEDWEQKTGQECFNSNKLYESSWGNTINQMCASLGDCQGKVTIQVGEDVVGNETITKTKNYLGIGERR